MLNLSQNLQTIKDIIFSRKCSICGRIVRETGKYICKDCFKILSKKSQLKNVGNYYYLFYYEKDIKNLIADYKLKNRRYLSREIGMLIKDKIYQIIREKNINSVIPVPISNKRYRERGFNQVEELLDVIGIKYDKIRRIKDTKHMYELLDETDRRNNIKDAFYSRLDLKGKNILLVDDIVTTGKTIKEMISEIQKYSVPDNVYVFSIALSKIFKLEK